MEDSAKEGVVSSLQTIGDTVGAGDFLSSAVSQCMEGEEQEEDGPEEIELETGYTLTVITNEEIAEENEDGKKSWCGKTSCKNTTIVLAALFILPVVNVFALILDFAVSDMDNSNEQQTGTSSGAAPITTTPDPYFCEFNPWDPVCQDLYGRSWGALETTTVDPAFCEFNPLAPACQELYGRSWGALETTTVYPAFCEFNPLDPDCQRLNRRSWRAPETTTVDPTFCEFNPLDPDCQRLNRRSRRAPETTTVDPTFCEFNPSAPLCQQLPGTPGNGVETTSLAPRHSASSTSVTRANTEKTTTSENVCEQRPWLDVCSNSSERKKRSVTCVLFPWNVACPRDTSSKDRTEGMPVSSKVDYSPPKTVSENILANEKLLKLSFRTPPKAVSNTMSLTLLTRKITTNAPHKLLAQATAGTSVEATREKESANKHSFKSAFLAVVTSAETRGRRKKRDAGNDDGSIDTDVQQVSEFQAVVDTYNIVYGLFGIISGIMITAFNYRITAFVGSCISGVSCLVAAFIPRNAKLMAFVLGALPGIGNNFMMTSVMVALLEHFRERSHLALSVTNASGYLGKIAFTLIQIFLFPEIGVDASDRKGLLQYQAATYAICICGAVALSPLNLHMKDAPEQTVRGRMLDISGLQMLRSPVLYVLAAVFLFDGLGGGIPEQHIEQASGVFLLSMLLVFFIALGSLVGSIVSCCLSRKEMSLVVSLVLVAIFGILMGVLTLTVEAFEKFQYAISYSLLFGMFAGLRTPLMMRTILLALGEDHLGLTVGLTSFASGLGSIIGDESAGAIVKNHNRVDAAFYLSGLSLLASAAACLLLLKMEAKVSSQATMSDTDQEAGSTKEGGRTEASVRAIEHLS